MPTQQQDKPTSHREKRQPQQLNAVIGKQVIHALGEPGGRHQVQVRHLWNDCYRVNVLVGEDAQSARIAHSYFIVTDDAGTVLTATPTIRRQY
jgi:hypothetical protein